MAFDVNQSKILLGFPPPHFRALGISIMKEKAMILTEFTFLKADAFGMCGPGKDWSVWQRVND